MAIHILIKYASRSRPVRFFEGMDNIMAKISDKVNYTILCTLDEDDPTMNDQGVIQRLLTYPRTIPVFGKSLSKIDAINRDMETVTRWDILVNMSDDMRFTAFGWDQLVREGFQHNAPEFDAFLHYPDTTAKNMLSTMSIIGRKYYERDKYIYHPTYLSLFADNEAMDVAQSRGKYFYMGIELFDHFHPAYQLTDWDEQYIRQQKLWGVDEANYNDRKANNFYEAKIIDTHTDSQGTGGTVS